MLGPESQGVLDWAPATCPHMRGEAGPTQVSRPVACRHAPATLPAPDPCLPPVIRQKPLLKIARSEAFPGFCTRTASPSTPAPQIQTHAPHFHFHFHLLGNVIARGQGIHLRGPRHLDPPARGIAQHSSNE